jgi:hypothetical protein
VGGGGPRVGKYRVEVKNFESVALPALKAHTKFDVIVIDEIGTMELESVEFSDALADLLQTKTHVVASLHNKYRRTYQIYGMVFNVTPISRNIVYNRMMNHLVRTLKSKPVKSTAKTKWKTPKPKGKPKTARKRKKTSKKKSKTVKRKKSRKIRKKKIKVKPKKVVKAPKKKSKGLLHRIRRLFGR